MRKITTCALAAALAALSVGLLGLTGPSSSGQFRYLATDTTASASALTAGRYTAATLDAALPGASSNIIGLGRLADPAAPRSRGCELTFFGAGADNATGNYRVWQVKRGRAGFATLGGNDLELAFLGGGTFTLSTAVGAAAATTVLSTERIADTVTWTQGTASTSPKGMGDALEAVYGSPAAAAYSPADNTPGRLFVPELGNGDLLIELWVGTATGVNCVVDVGS